MQVYAWGRCLLEGLHVYLWGHLRVVSVYGRLLRLLLSIIGRGAQLHWLKRVLLVHQVRGRELGHRVLSHLPCKPKMRVHHRRLVAWLHVRKAPPLVLIQHLVSSREVVELVGDVVGLGGLGVEGLGGGEGLEEGDLGEVVGFGLEGRAGGGGVGEGGLALDEGEFDAVGLVVAGLVGVGEEGGQLVVGELLGSLVEVGAHEGREVEGLEVVGAVGGEAAGLLLLVRRLLLNLNLDLELGLLVALLEDLVGLLEPRGTKVVLGQRQLEVLARLLLLVLLLLVRQQLRLLVEGRVAVRAPEPARVRVADVPVQQVRRHELLPALLHVAQERPVRLPAVRPLVVQQVPLLPEALLAPLVAAHERLLPCVQSLVDLQPPRPRVPLPAVLPLAHERLLP